METPLFAEIDRLSAAWDILDEQVNRKVSNLSKLEERLEKTQNEVCNSSGLTFTSLMWLQKTKTEIKYLQSQRDKADTEAERKALAKAHESQRVVVERLLTSEHNLKEQLVCLSIPFSKFA
jgi:E3 ubiquitin-protein ligase BRE1